MSASLSCSNCASSDLNFADLNQFLNEFAPGAKDNYNVVLVNGGTNPQNFSEEGEGEAALDVQEALGIAYPAKGTFWSTNGIPPIWPDDLTTTALNNAGAGNEPYLNWVQYVLSQSSVPNVISTSYDDDEQSVPIVCFHGSLQCYKLTQCVVVRYPRLRRIRKARRPGRYPPLLGRRLWTRRCPAHQLHCQRWL